MSAYKFIADIKLFGFVWHLGLDIRRHEDVFQIHPLPLSLNPLLHDLHDELDVLGELFSARLDGLDVSVSEGVVHIGQGFV